jgi:UbiD family decarboxylase
MSFTDLRTFIDGAARIGELKQIDGADWNLEIGCLTELMAEQDGPLLLFDNITGYPKGFRIAANVLASARRFALALGLATDAPKLEILKTWRNKIRDLKPFAPIEVSSGPILENILDGDKVDLGIFPTPKWHEHDGGRYIGTGDMVVIKDPDSGWVNVGTYRSCIVGKDRVTLWIIEQKHGKQIARIRDNIELGEVYGNMITVTKGVRVGDPVIVTGATLVDDGQAVLVIPPPEK